MVDWDNIKLIKTHHFEERLVKRNITMDAVVELFENPKLIFRRNNYPNRRYLIIGDAYGNIYELILEHKESNRYYLITIYEASETHKRLYRSKIK